MSLTTLEDQGWFPFAIIAAYGMIAVGGKFLGEALARWLRRTGRM